MKYLLLYFLLLSDSTGCIVHDFIILKKDNIRVAVLVNANQISPDESLNKVQCMRLGEALAKMSNFAISVLFEGVGARNKSKKSVQRFSEIDGINMGFDALSFIGTLQVPAMVEPIDPTIIIKAIRFHFPPHKVPLVGVVNLKSSHNCHFPDILKYTFSDSLNEYKNVLSKLKYKLNCSNFEYSNDLTCQSLIKKLIDVSELEFGKFKNFLEEESIDQNLSIVKVIVLWWFDNLTTAIEIFQPEGLQICLDSIESLKNEVFLYFKTYPTDIDDSESTYKRLYCVLENLAYGLSNQIKEACQTSKLGKFWGLFNNATKYIPTISAILKVTKYAHESQMARRIIICLEEDSANELINSLTNEIGYSVITRKPQESSYALCSNHFNQIIQKLNEKQESIAELHYK